MAQIEDMRPAGKSAHDTLGFVDQGLATSDHVAGCKVALNAAVNLHIGGGPIGINRIIQRHTIRANCAVKADVTIAGFAWEGDDRQVGMCGL